MKTLSIDIETYSDVPLQKTGVYRYVESSNFEILLFAYSADSQPVRVIDLACGEQIPKEVLLALEDESVIKWAFNAAFERICLSRFLGYPTGEYLEPESWRCSMIWAATMGLPLSLEGVGAVLGLEKQKLSEGKDLIKYFCQPCTPTKTNEQRTRNRPFHAPDKWAMFKKYNVRDVETEIGIQQRLSKFPVPDQVWDEYHQDQEVNDRGVRLDMELVAAAIEMDTRSRTQLVDTMKGITQLENPNSVKQMKAWLSDNGLQTDTLSQLIRTAFIPREGAQFLVADFSAIEARVIAWFAGEKWRQDVFAKGGDIYCASASQMFKVPVEKHGINGHLRQKGKIAELALGYGGSVGALKAMGALDMGLTEEELHPLVDAWRQSNPNIVKFWWDVDHAVMEAVKFKHTTSEYGLTFSYRSDMLFITFPWALLLFLSVRDLRIYPHRQRNS